MLMGQVGRDAERLRQSYASVAQARQKAQEEAEGGVPAARRRTGPGGGKLMKVPIAAGGTAGHVNPVLAIAGGIKERWPEAEIHFAGRGGGMEYGLVTAAGYPFHPIEVRGLQRSLKPENLVRNAKAAWYLARSGSASRRMLAEVKPDLVPGTGGYVSGAYGAGGGKARAENRPARAKRLPRLYQPPAGRRSEPHLRRFSNRAGAAGPP